GQRRNPGAIRVRSCFHLFTDCASDETNKFSAGEHVQGNEYQNPSEQQPEQGECLFSTPFTFSHNASSRSCRAKSFLRLHRCSQRYGSTSSVIDESSPVNPANIGTHPGWHRQR